MASTLEAHSGYVIHTFSASAHKVVVSIKNIKDAKVPIKIYNLYGKISAEYYDEPPSNKSGYCEANLLNEITNQCNKKSQRYEAIQREDNSWKLVDILNGSITADQHTPKRQLSEHRNFAELEYLKELFYSKRHADLPIDLPIDLTQNQLSDSNIDISDADLSDDANYSKSEISSVGEEEPIARKKPFDIFEHREVLEHELEQSRRQISVLNSDTHKYELRLCITDSLYLQFRGQFAMFEAVRYVALEA
jgi:hypothetical protein